MRDLKTAMPKTFRSVRFVLTDMDETLTYKGRLPARTYAALEKLQAAGITVIPVTAAPAGWCDQMAHMWPVDGVIAENGGLFMRRQERHNLSRLFWHEDLAREKVSAQLNDIGHEILQSIPSTRLADDQPFRLTSLAFAKTEMNDIDNMIVEAMRARGLHVTLNNLWILGWIGSYDKLAMARRVMLEVFSVNIDKQKEEILYSGDSVNDAPMFGFFHHTVGVSTVTSYLDEIPVHPNWITDGPGGEGFVEIAEAVIRAHESN